MNLTETLTENQAIVSNMHLLPVLETDITYKTNENNIVTLKYNMLNSCTEKI